MIYNEFGDNDDPLESPDPIPVPMCPTFYGCWVVLALGGGFLFVCVLTVGWCVLAWRLGG